MKKNILTSIPFIIVFICVISYNMIGSKVASDGTLIEPFFLIPISWLFFIIGIIFVVLRITSSCLKNKQ